MLFKKAALLLLLLFSLSAKAMEQLGNYHHVENLQYLAMLNIPDEQNDYLPPHLKQAVLLFQQSDGNVLLALENGIKAKASIDNVRVLFGFLMIHPEVINNPSDNSCLNFFNDLGKLLAIAFEMKYYKAYQMIAHAIKSALSEDSAFELIDAFLDQNQPIESIKCRHGSSLDIGALGWIGYRLAEIMERGSLRGFAVIYSFSKESGIPENGSRINKPRRYFELLKECHARFSSELLISFGIGQDIIRLIAGYYENLNYRPCGFSA